MGVSLGVVGVIPQDATWEKMRNIYKACEEAGVTVPPEVENFFDHVALEHLPKEREVDIGDAMTWRSGMYSGEIDLAKLQQLHPHVKIIKVSVE